jgi:hypothetical protein
LLWISFLDSPALMMNELKAVSAARVELRCTGPLS